MTLFVIGKPINHSLSPVIHNFWMEKYQIELEYKKMEVEKDSLPSLIEKVRRREITGLNTKQIVNNLNKIRKRYRNFKGEWEKGKI